MSSCQPGRYVMFRMLDHFFVHQFTTFSPRLEVDQIVVSCNMEGPAAYSHVSTCGTRPRKAPGSAWSHISRLPPPPPPLQKQQDFPGNMGEILFLNFILQQQQLVAAFYYHECLLRFALISDLYIFCCQVHFDVSIRFLFLPKPKMKRYCCNKLILYLWEIEKLWFLISYLKIEKLKCRVKVKFIEILSPSSKFYFFFISSTFYTTSTYILGCMNILL